MKASTSNKVKQNWQEMTFSPCVPLSDIDSLMLFANQDVTKATWNQILWDAMGKEKVCWVSYATNNGDIKKEQIGHIDIMSHVSTEIGLDWVFPIEKEQEISLKIEKAIKKVEPVLPKIFNKKPTFKLAEKLQKKMREILDDIIGKVTEIEGRANGKVLKFPENRKSTHAKNFASRLIVDETDSLDLPWDITYFEECQDILKMIQKKLGMSETRQAIVDTSGFICFDDKDSDASRTLGWMLVSFVNEIFRKKRNLLKKCRRCKRYFIHRTLKPKKFCSDICRYDFHNYGLNDYE